MSHELLRRLGLLCLVLGVCLGTALVFFRGGSLTIQQFDSVSVGEAPPATALDEEALEAKLLSVGLHPTGLLSDLGVDDHLSRMAKGEVTAALLMQYADAIEALSQRSRDRGQALPPTLWDVSTPALRDAGLTVYDLTIALASEAGGLHVDLLSDSYRAFLQARPNALDGALALLPLARTYVETLPEAARAEREPHAKTTAKPHC